MTMKNYALLGLLLFLAGGVFAQNDLGYTHFVFNKLPYNPAYAGSKDVLDTRVLYRNQWMGIDGAPQTLSANAHGSFFQNKVGIGFDVQSDQIGKTQHQLAGLSYSYRMTLNNNLRLSVGLRTGIEHARVDWTLANPEETGDNAIPTAASSALRPNFGAGIYLTNDKFYAGLSMPRMLNSPVDPTNGLDSDPFNYRRTTYFMAGYLTRLSPLLQFKPSVLVSYNAAAPLDVDLQANFLLLDKLWLGVGHRLGDSFDALVQYELNNRLQLGLSYDFTTSRLQKATSGSYELLVGYTFKCADCKVKSLRYF